MEFPLVCESFNFLLTTQLEMNWNEPWQTSSKRQIFCTLMIANDDRSFLFWSYHYIIRWRVIWYELFILTTSHQKTRTLFKHFHKKKKTEKKNLRDKPANTTKAEAHYSAGSKKQAEATRLTSPAFQPQGPTEGGLGVGGGQQQTTHSELC